jgi:phosphate-selective porin OprO/OprP
MLVSLLLAAVPAQQDVTPPPGPEVVAQARELPSEPESAAIPAAHDPWELRSADGQLTLRLHGKFDMDWAFFDPESGLEATTGKWSNGAELRRARLGVMGHAGEWVKYRLNADLADSEIRDAYVELLGVAGPGTLRVGHFREPIGLSNSTSGHNHTFMERPLANALFPSRNLGVSWQTGFDEQRGSWTVGVFRETDSDGVSTDGTGGNELALTSRLAWLLVDQDSGRERVHLGGSFSWRNPDDGLVAFDGGADTTIGPDLIDTGEIAADSVTLFGLESAWIHGPSSFLAEYTYAGFDQSSGTNPGMKGWVLEARHFLTGEVRDYQKGRASFGGVKPNAPFDPKGSGRGAYEVGFRVSRLDLQDEGVAGGDGLNMAVAWNWHLSEFIRFQTNLVRADRENSGDVHAILFRFHFRF